MSLLIKNGRIITAASDQVADIFIEGEKIRAIGKKFEHGGKGNDRCFGQAGISRWH